MTQVASAFINELLGVSNPEQVDLAPAGAEVADSTEDLNNFSYEEVDDRISEFQGDDLVREALEKGLDLREYSKKTQEELKALEQEHILDYAKQAQALVDLYNEIESCDDILGNMQSLLTGFQENLGQISGEIATLQDKSKEMTIKLKNRTLAQSSLGSSLDGIVIGSDLIIKICEGEVNEFFVQHLSDLNDKMTYMKAQQHNKVPIKAFKELFPEVERLRLRAAEKSRDYLLKKIESLKSPNTNIVIIQQNMLLKFKELYWFLFERHGEAAAEIRANYIITVGNYFLASFDKYIKSMQKLQTIIADRLDLIGCEESAKRGLFSGKLALKDKTNVFTLGDRINALVNPDSGIILAHVAEEQSLKFPFEAVFKSVSRLLMDNSSSEYIFTIDFFNTPRKSKPAGMTLEPMGLAFTEVFEPTLKLVQGYIKQVTESSFDAVGVLLCIRLNNQNMRIMQKRRIPCLENFMMAINMLLWPRFQLILDMHIDSLRKAVPSRLMAVKDVTPHYITRRYAEFSASILTLNQGYQDALLVHSLQRLRSEVESLLLRMSVEFSDTKSRVIFLINNFDLVVTILSEYTASSFEEEKAYFAGILENRTDEFVEEELRPYFGTLMGLVAEGEQHPDLLKMDGDKFERIADNFNNSWKQAIGTINNSIIQSFTNFQNGARILQSALTRLLLYYKRFLVLWEKRFGSRKQRVQPVGLQSVMVEIKKFRSNFQ
ncbi:Sac2 family-domain-containing protein [Polychytrium aggregatum]|uniref:Sac2 family-domain-containing protein n=1 Tax=Polychytrium aggregatum TaxID=110093 RepID=UPI0022FDC553|nr:Sac2 family-domain-containing protein [Polychytrium aggregatum]KAI9202758.1 Sac2 family-domain-containing protein [Polychytrium aggregatum]